MSLHDAHLQQALHNAPDREAMPAASTRAAVMRYAIHAMKPLKRPFYAGWYPWWKGLHFAHWELASAGSLFAALLVLVVFWNHQPENSEWADATSAQIATVEGAAEKAAELKADISSDNNPNEHIPLKKALPAPAPLAAPEARSIPARPNSAGRPVVAEDKNVAVAAIQDETRPAAGALPGQALTKSALPADEAASIKDTARSEIIKAPESVDALDSGASVSAAKEVARPRLEPMLKDNVAAQAHSLPKRKSVIATLVGDSGNADLAAVITKDGGQVVASRDIQAGLLRNLYLQAYIQPHNVQECTVTRPEVAELDSVTGYRVEVISGCYSTTALIREIEIYNQTMRAWHAKNGQ